MICRLKLQASNHKLRLQKHVIRLASTKHSSVSGFCLNCKCFPQISKCFGSCGLCFDANAKVFPQVLTW